MFTLYIRKLAFINKKAMHKSSTVCFEFFKKRKSVFLKSVKNGQVDSPESLETPEIKEMMANFTKVTKYLTKLKDTLINYVKEKSHVIRQ